MKKYKSKSELLNKWAKKIDVQKHYFNLMKEKGLVKGSFYNSPVYENLSNRKKQAVYRYENREKISKQRKERREIQKQRAEKFEQEFDSQKTVFSGNAIEAFSGRKRNAEFQFIRATIEKGSGFVGVISMDVDGVTAIDEEKYFSVDGYQNAVDSLLSSIYRRARKKGSDLLKSIMVDRKVWYNKETGTLFHYTSISIDNENE